MLRINATEKERELQAVEDRREARKDVLRTLGFTTLVALLFFGPFYLITGSWKMAIVVPTFLLGRMLMNGRARRMMLSPWRSD